MDNPDDPGVPQTGRPARNRVEGRLRFWLCTSIVGFIVSVGLAFLCRFRPAQTFCMLAESTPFCFHLLNVLDTTPPFKTVPLLIWIIMGASLVGAIVLSVIARLVSARKPTWTLRIPAIWGVRDSRRIRRHGVSMAGNGRTGAKSAGRQQRLRTANVCIGS